MTVKALVDIASVTPNIDHALVVAALLWPHHPRGSLFYVGRRSTLRASDADREQVAERLRKATGEGRLSAEELEQRLSTLFRARTYGELDALVADLPSGTPARSRTRPLAHVRNIPAPALVVLVPMAMAIAVAAVMIVVTVFACWVLMITIAWLALGRRRPYYPPMRYYRRTVHHAYGRWRA
jgi:hypothetical protein